MEQREFFTDYGEANRSVHLGTEAVLLLVCCMPCIAAYLCHKGDQQPFEACSLLLLQVFYQGGHWQGQLWCCVLSDRQLHRGEGCYQEDQQCV